MKVHYFLIVVLILSIEQSSALETQVSIINSNPFIDSQTLTGSSSNTYIIDVENIKINQTVAILATS